MTPNRRAFLAGLASTSLLGLTACSQAGNPGAAATASSAAGGPSSSSTSSAAAAVATLVVWADSTKLPALQAAAPAFAQANGVTFDFVSKPGDQLSSLVTQQAPTGNGPDVFVDAFNNTGNYVDNGVLSPITIATPSDFSPIALAGVRYQGQVWAMPLNTENVALYRNTSLVPEAPASWDQMIATGRELVSSGKAKYPFFVQSGDSGAADPYHLYPLMTSFGIDAYELGSDGSYDFKKLALGGDGGRAFATWLAESGKNGILNPSYTFDIGTAAFVAGEAPFFLSGPWCLPTFKDKVQYAVDPIPSPGGQTAAPFVGGQGLYLNKYSKNQLVAQKFIADYMGQAANQVTYYKTGLRAPANTAAAQEVASDTDITAFSKVAQTGVPFPNTTAFNALFTAMGTTEGAIVAGQAGDPAAQWQQLVDKYQAEASA